MTNLSEVSIEVIESFSLDGKANAKVIAAAKRIAEKGFEVTDILFEGQTSVKYGWGRSSNATLVTSRYQVHFWSDEGEHYLLIVIETKNVRIESRNPHDTKAPTAKPAYSFIPADIATRNALGMVAA